LPGHRRCLTALQHTGHSAYLCFMVLCWQWVISFTDSRPHVFRNVPLSSQFYTVTRLYCWVTEAAARVVSGTLSTTAWTIYSTVSSIGWMFLSVSSSSSEWLFLGVCRAMLLCTLWTAASLRLMLPVVSGSAPLCKSPSAHRATIQSIQLH